MRWHWNYLFSAIKPNNTPKNRHRPRRRETEIEKRTHKIRMHDHIQMFSCWNEVVSMHGAARAYATRLQSWGQSRHKQNKTQRQRLSYFCIQTTSEKRIIDRFGRTPIKLHKTKQKTNRQIGMENSNCTAVEEETKLSPMSCFLRTSHTLVKHCRAFYYYWSSSWAISSFFSSSLSCLWFFVIFNSLLSMRNEKSTSNKMKLPFIERR